MVTQSQLTAILESVKSTEEQKDIYIQISQQSDITAIKLLLVILNKLGVKPRFLDSEFYVIGFRLNIKPEVLLNLFEGDYLMYYTSKNSKVVKSYMWRRNGLHHSTNSKITVGGITILKKIYNESDYEKLLAIQEI